MKTTLTFILTGLLAMIATSRGGQETDTLERTVTKEGVTLTLQITPPVSKIEDLAVHILIQSKRPEPIKYVENTDLCGVYLFLKDAKGTPVDYTLWGKSTLDTAHIMSYKQMDCILANGEQIDINPKLTRYFKVEKPGIYQLDIEWREKPVSKKPIIEAKQTFFLVL